MKLKKGRKFIKTGKISMNQRQIMGVLKEIRAGYGNFYDRQWGLLKLSSSLSLISPCKHLRSQTMQQANICKRMCLLTYASCARDVQGCDMERLEKMSRQRLGGSLGLLNTEIILSCCLYSLCLMKGGQQNEKFAFALSHSFTKDFRDNRCGYNQGCGHGKANNALPEWKTT